MSDLRSESEIADGIHWIRGRGVNSYVVDNGQDELILIDTGMSRKAKNLMKYIRNELSDKTPAAIFLTHHHLDHMGGLHYLEDHFHPTTYAHPIDAEVITGKRDTPIPTNILVKPFMWLFFKLLGPKTIERIELVEDGQEEQGFQVWHLPGHTMGSVGFQRNNSIFSGDAAVTGKDEIKIGPMFVAEDHDAVYRSFKKLADLDFDQILPGHGEPLLEDASLRMRDALEKYNL